MGATGVLDPQSQNYGPLAGLSGKFQLGSFRADHGRCGSKRPTSCFADDPVPSDVPVLRVRDIWSGRYSATCRTGLATGDSGVAGNTHLGPGSLLRRARKATSCSSSVTTTVGANSAPYCFRTFASTVAATNQLSTSLNIHSTQ